MATLVTDFVELYTIVNVVLEGCPVFPLTVMVGDRELGVLENEKFLRVTDPDTADYWAGLRLSTGRPEEEGFNHFAGWAL